MTWTLDTLRKAIKERGESPPSDRDVGEALLAHERYRGRTEENYDRDKAYRDLRRILERRDEPFPEKRSGEYPGMAQLRIIARDIERQREEEREKERKAAAEKQRAMEEQEAKQAEHETDEEMDDERER